MADGSPEKALNTQNDGGSRLKQIRQVLVRNHITRGITPEKLRIILEELGPTFIKLGQIMSLHSDILPKAYCEELMKLNSDVTPMPFETVEEIINESCGAQWASFFKSIDTKPLGSASIAQVHKAVLKDGSDVIIKVQRKGIYETMSRDISLLHRLVKLMPPVGDLKNIVDLDMILNEMWSVAQQEMDFLKEASNLEEFAHNNKNINYIRCPKLYREYSTSKVLVMEYIGGFGIDDVEDLKANGYDLHEIGVKFVNNYIKQVMDDGFFHADPHPGNVKIMDGKIVWIDMGMMGRLSDHDRRVMVKGVRGIGLHDVTMVENAVLEIGDFRGKPDRGQLYQDLKGFLDEYGNASLGDISLADSMSEIMEIMKKNEISMPHGMTMLCRGLTVMQGVLSEIAPEISMSQIASNRVMEETLDNMDWKSEIRKDIHAAWRISKKGAEVPSLTADALKEYLAGQAGINISLHSSRNFNDIVHSAVRNFVIGLCLAALLISSSIICTTDMTPKIMGLPFLGFIGYFAAIAVGTALCIRYLWKKYKRK